MRLGFSWVRKFGPMPGTSLPDTPSRLCSQGKVFTWCGSRLGPETLTLVNGGHHHTSMGLGPAEVEKLREKDPTLSEM